MNIIYLRRSGNKQEITIDSQLKDITDKGYTPDKVFSDTISGSSEVHKRKGLVQSLNEINKGDKFIVHSYDRLSRDVMIFGFIEKEILKLGGELISIREDGFNGNEPTQILMRQISNVFSQYELNLIKMRTRLSLESKRSNGEKLGGTRPYGFDVLVDDNTGKKVLNPNEDEQKTLKSMKRWRKKGDTYKTITERLNERNIPSTTGNTWSLRCVHHIINK